MKESSTTAAPTTPIGAARMVPITITATASAPGIRFIRISVASSMSRAEPERSRIVPMKMNMGIDTSTGSTATPPHMRSRTFESRKNGNTSSHHPMAANTSAVPPITNATGKPQKMTMNIVTNMISARLSASQSSMAPPHTSSAAWPICRSTSAAGRRPNRKTIRRIITLTMPASSSQRPTYITPLRIQRWPRPSACSERSPCR